MVKGNCICPEGNFLNDKGECLECNKNKCKKCTLTADNCTSCAEGRTDEPICRCKPFFFEDPTDKKCKECNWKCYSCEKTATNCISCIGNRKVPNCDCPDETYEASTTKMVLLEKKKPYNHHQTT